MAGFCLPILHTMNTIVTLSRDILDSNELISITYFEISFFTPCA